MDQGRQQEHHDLDRHNARFPLPRFPREFPPINPMLIRHGMQEAVPPVRAAPRDPPVNAFRQLPQPVPPPPFRGAAQDPPANAFRFRPPPFRAVAQDPPANAIRFRPPPVRAVAQDPPANAFRFRPPLVQADPGNPPVPVFRHLPQVPPPPPPPPVDRERIRMAEIIGRFPRIVHRDEQQVAGALDDVLAVVPDIDVDFARRLCARFDVNDVLEYVMDAPRGEIPHRMLPQAQMVREQEAEQPQADDTLPLESPVKQLPVADAFRRLSSVFVTANEVADNVNKFSAVHFKCSDTMKTDKFALSLLCSLSPLASIATVRLALTAFGGHIAPAYAALFAIENKLRVDDFGGWQPTTKQRRLNKGARHPQMFADNDARWTPELRAEVDLVNRLRKPDPEVGEKVECPVCFETVMKRKAFLCVKDDGSIPDEQHGFCGTCVKGQVEQAANGDAMVADFIGLRCMDPDCQNVILWKDIRAYIPGPTRKRLSERFTEANIKAAGLEDIERCRRCTYAVTFDVPKEENKVFECTNCGDKYCRICGQNWDDLHIGRKCDELAGAAVRKYHEEMSEAVLRKCSRCHLVFDKVEGCNKMTCRCGLTQCYLCRAEGIGYDHFCQHPRNPNEQVCPLNCPKRCLLFSDPKVVDRRMLGRIKENAMRDERLAGNVSPLHR